ncbi:uncharacterized protein LOC134574776 [Pelobates fuscus]|uniref:uncharacterized protein LOC134574776 n=1 Tax=Pelobates fuscus TaxID=191477 RepID=UPI002FE45F5F
MLHMNNQLQDRCMPMPSSTSPLSQSNNRKYIDFLLEENHKVFPYCTTLDYHKYKWNAVPKCSARKKLSEISLNSSEERLEDSMWMMRQEARALYRSHGDVIRRQRTLQNLVKHYDQEIEKKISDGEKQKKELDKKNEKMAQEKSKKREQITKDNILRNKLGIEFTQSKQRGVSAFSLDCDRMLNTRNTHDHTRQELKEKGLEEKWLQTERRLRSIELQKWHLESERSATQKYLARKQRRESKTALEITNQMRQNLKKQKDIQQQIYELSQVRQAEKVGNTKQVHLSKPETGSIVSEHEVPGQKKWKLEHGVSHLQVNERKPTSKTFEKITICKTS